MNQLTEAIVTIASLIVGVAILAVLVSGKSQTASVIGAGSAAFSNALSAATGPVTGSVSAPVNSAGGGFGGIMPNFGLPNL